MNVLVAGATGMVGRVTAGMLAGGGARVRALVRPTCAPAKQSDLHAGGIELVHGDLTDPSTLAAACEGMDAVVSTVSAMPFCWAEGNTIGDVDRDGQANLIEAAERAAVTRFVLLSFPHQPGIAFPLDDAKIAAEDRLKAGDVDHTILLASFFMEVWLSPAFGFDYLESSATIFGDGDNKISWVSFHDVARTCVEALSSAAARNATVSVGGPQPLSALDVVKTFEEVGGKPWKVEHVPVEALERQLDQSPDEMQKSVAGLQISYACGDWAMDPKSYLVRDGLKSIEAYARESMGS